jgi:hypothetical protein
MKNKLDESLRQSAIYQLLGRLLAFAAAYIKEHGDDPKCGVLTHEAKYILGRWGFLMRERKKFEKTS